MEEQERGKEETEMPGPRQKLSVLEANGRKHLSKAEKAARAAREVELPKPAKMRVPRWLPEHLKADFRALAKELLAADMGAAQLDRDTVGRYLVAQHQFTAACRMVQDALDQEDPDLVNKWTRAQKAYFAQARACANDLGLTITSRCRLVVPEGAQKQEENPFLQLMEARRRWWSGRTRGRGGHLPCLRGRRRPSGSSTGSRPRMRTGPGAGTGAISMRRSQKRTANLSLPPGWASAT